MTTAALAIDKAQKNLRAKAESLDLLSINWKMVCVAGVFISMALLIFYVWQINALTRGFYLVNGFQKQISQLSQENKDLQISFAESSFLGQALAKIQAMDFQKTTSVKYVKILDNSVATIKK